MTEESPSRRVRINLPDYYKETNEEVWEDLEKYLFEGFLTASAFVLDKTYVFKTLNHSEIRNLEFLKPLRSSPPEVKSNFRASFIAYSIFMVDSQNILFERPKHISRLIKIMQKIPPKIADKIIENLSAINERASRLYPLTEVYVHENRSRFRWLQLQSIPIHHSSATGISGTDNLSMNYVQSAWVALNRILDRREEIEKDWAHAKFIGSCFNGKGVRSIDQKDRGRIEREKSERDELRIKVLYEYLNRNAEAPPQPMHSLPDGRQAEVIKKFQATTPEELRDQLEKALSGEKDYHDLVVEAKQKELQTRIQELEDHKRTLYSAPVSVLPGSQIAGPQNSSTSRVISSKSEVDEYISRIEKLRLSNLEQNRKMMKPDMKDDDKTNE